jgi:hypothetical protein
VVDGEVLHENGVIYLDEAVQTLGGVMVVTGVAGSGGNACGAAPFVLALPDGAAPALYGPVDSCREFTMQVQPDALVFSTEPLPSEPGEIWVWNPVSGLTEALPEEFSADTGAGREVIPTLRSLPRCRRGLGRRIRCSPNGFPTSARAISPPRATWARLA